MNFLDIAFHRLRKLQTNLTDLHDPQGVYWHRACNACLATLISAAGLTLFPTVAQPLLVIASLCFVLAISLHNRPGQPSTLLGAFGVVLVSTVLLILAQSQPILQALILISLGFLVHYLTQYGAVFAGGMFIWILTLLASVLSPSLSQLPRTILNLALGGLITYLCYFWLLPYRPYPVLLAVLKRTRLRLAARLQQAVEHVNAQSPMQSAFKPFSDLDQRLVSLMNAQETLVEQVARSHKLSKPVRAYYHHIVSAHAELFEAILVLEHRLQDLPSTVSAQLQPELTQLSQRALNVLEQVSLHRPINASLHFDASVNVLDDWPNDQSPSPEMQIQQQNARRTVQTLLSKLKAVVDLALKPMRITDVV